MLCLGIETSCDETGIGIVKDGRFILSNVVQTQVDLHAIYGGVVPEIACRAHIETIVSVLQEALDQAGVRLSEIDAIAVTTHPGLIGALLVGVNFAKSLALALEKPLIGVDHLHGHIYACKLAFFKELEYPCISMVVSGGHTSLFISESEIRHTLVGRTVDDASGEAFDKVAKILGLSFPGGPSIQKASEGGERDRIRFPRSSFKQDRLDFSFSGIKTAVLYHVKGQGAKAQRELSQQEISDIAASFQEAVVDMLIERIMRAVERYGLRRVAIGGGVACNKRLREKFEELARSRDIDPFFPPGKFCTDNGAMIAGIGYHLLRAGSVADLYLDARATKHTRI
jgi:N6-L-threonylcarbamoyladenine synthase